jgi:peptidoglycan/xylan/chitin deacetylase (PgdA/CDA1 family)
MPHKKTHSVMFHHFHDDEIHKPAQGSLSASGFRQMLDWLYKHYSLLDADDYQKNFESGTLKDSDICLSFDDALKCQYDIAIPILREFELGAFFFVYSSAFTKDPDPLEIYRFFRTDSFSDIDDFYNDFFNAVEQRNSQDFLTHQLIFKDLNYLSEFPFYSENDKWFRYLRDKYLLGNKYHEIMHELMQQKAFDIKLAKAHLWMSEEDLKSIEKQGHMIGLHSFSHPTKMSNLSKSEQESEYYKNNKHLTNLIGKPITVMSHPCGDYNKDTLNILSKMDIKIGFRSNMSETDNPSSFEIPREDHANVLKEMSR